MIGEYRLTGDPQLALYTGQNDNGDPVNVKLKIWEPAENVPHRGTIIFGSGGNGSEFTSEQTADEEEHNVSKMIADLAWMGFRVIDRAWVKGWAPGYPGQQAELKKYGDRLAASRYAALVKELYRRYHCPPSTTDCGAFVLVGQSGGSAEITYGLTSHSLGAYVDLALLLSGPAVAKLDEACDNFDQGTCNDVDQNDGWCNSLFCQYRPDITMCPNDWNGSSCDLTCAIGTSWPTFDRPKCVFKYNVAADKPDPTCNGVCNGQQDINSVLYPTAPSFFPRTVVHVMLGLQDTAQGPAGGLSVYNHITSRKRLQFVDTPHEILSVAEGRRVVKNAIDYWTRPFVGDVDRNGVIENAVDGAIITNNLGQSFCVGGFGASGNPDVDNDGDCDSADAAKLSRVRGSADKTRRNCNDVDLVDYCGIQYSEPSPTACAHNHPTSGGFLTCAALSFCTPPSQGM